MAWDRFIDIAVNLSARGDTTFLVSLATTTQRRLLDMVQSDVFPVRLRFARATGRTNIPLEVVQLEAGSVIVFSGKLTSALSGDTLLFFADEFTEDEDDDGFFYSGTINTATAAVLAAFASLAPSKQTLPLTVEVEIQNADNTQRTSFQNNALLRRQVYAGEGIPEDADPEYPPPSNLLTVANRLAELGWIVDEDSNLVFPGAVRIGPAGLQIWNPITEKFHPLGVTGLEGNLQPTFGPGID